MAEEQDLDLVLVNEEKGICKIVNYSKVLYEQKKAKKQSKGITLKEIKFNPGIAQHDLNIKLKNAEKIVKAGDRVKLIMQYRGRLAQRIEDGREVMEGCIEQLSEIAKVYSPLKREGNNWVVTFEKYK